MKWRLGKLQQPNHLWIVNLLSAQRHIQTVCAIGESVRDRKCFCVPVKCWMEKREGERENLECAHLIRSSPYQQNKCLCSHDRGVWYVDVDAKQSTIGHKVHTWNVNFVCSPRRTGRRHRHPHHSRNGQFPLEEWSCRPLDEWCCDENNAGHRSRWFMCFDHKTLWVPWNISENRNFA